MKKEIRKIFDNEEVSIIEQCLEYYRDDATTSRDVAGLEKNSELYKKITNILHKFWE